MPLECKEIQIYQLLNVIGMQGNTKYRMLNAIGVQGSIGTLPLVCEIKALVTTGCPPPKAQGQNTFQMKETKYSQRPKYIPNEREKYSHRKKYIPNEIDKIQLKAKFDE